ncbi:hypothetical protein [Falsiroseomonas sp. HW251]|uniref:hypothetical protein n=1 Tax=Falsiroseomonas sp. HW251 TaxID=3390998 RepID=UPI003D3135FB
MGENRLLSSVFTGWAVAQPAMLPILAVARPGPLAEPVSLLLALPLTLLWFGLPALLALCLWVMPLATLMVRLGQQRSAPLVLGVAGVAVALAFVRHQNNEEYGMAVAIGFAASLVAWACRAIIRPPWDARPTSG